MVVEEEVEWTGDGRGGEVERTDDGRGGRAGINGRESDDGVSGRVDQW